MVMTNKEQKSVMLQKPKPVMKLDILDANSTLIKLEYIRQGQKVVEEMKVPKALVAAMSDPGETSLGPLAAMKELADFYGKVVTPELDSIVLTGGVSVSASVLSSLIQRSYRAHSVVAATDQKISKELFLEHKEVQKLLKLTAALIKGVPPEEIEKLDIEDTTVWVTRTETEIVNTPTVSMKTKRLTCDCGSHREERKVALPDGTTVDTAQKLREQKLSNMPKVKDTLDDTFAKVEELRKNPLDRDERNAIVSYLNVNYLENPEDRLPIVP